MIGQGMIGKGMTRQGMNRAPAQPEYRRPWGLACWFDGGKLVVDSFVRGSAFRCPPRFVPLLAGAGDPVGEARLLARFAELGSPDPRRHLNTLLASGGLLTVGSPDDDRDRELARTWDWGIRTALYHFSTRNVGWATGQQEAVFLSGRTAAKPAPAAWRTNAGLSAVAACPPRRHRPGPLFETIERRRSRRNFSGAQISLHSLGQCLYGGLGITGFAELPYRPRTPFKNTPSAGGRNPFEAFVLVNAVDGLSPGVHHYSSSEHSLELRQPAPPGLRISALMGEQEWLDRAAAIVFLVAEFQRTMGASGGTGAFGTVYIEAGHIAQNIMLVATDLGLAGVQTNAFLHDQVEALLTVTAPTQAVLYAIALGEPSDDYDSISGDPISAEKKAVNDA